MAVQDHPIHPRTIAGPDHRNGCWNLPRTRKPYLVKNGHHFVEVQPGVLVSYQKWKEIPDTGSIECQSDLAMQPEFCAGCEHINPEHALALPGKFNFQTKEKP